MPKEPGAVVYTQKLRVAGGILSVSRLRTIGGKVPHGDHRTKLRELFALLESRGFAVVDETGKKHLKYKIKAPNGQGFLWVVGSTPSDRRAWLNATQTLRRMLADCGYPDERRYLRIDTAMQVARDLRSIYDLLDAIDAAVTTQQGRSP